MGGGGPVRSGASSTARSTARSEVSTAPGHTLLRGRGGPDDSDDEMARAMAMATMTMSDGRGLASFHALVKASGDTVAGKGGVTANGVK